MSFDIINIGSGWKFAEIAHTHPKAHQLRLKAEALKEKVKRTEEKVGIAKKNAELSEAIHQIKTAKALQIVCEATDTAHIVGENLRCKSALSTVINEIRKKQYSEAAFAAVEAADAKQLANSYELLSTQLINAVGIVEEAAEQAMTAPNTHEKRKIESRIKFAQKLIETIEKEELVLQASIENVEENAKTLDKLITVKELERLEAIQKVKEAANP